MIALSNKELEQIFKKSGFYYRECHGTGEILVGPNTFGTVPDMVFQNQSEARYFLNGWNAARKQFNV